MDFKRSVVALGCASALCSFSASAVLESQPIVTEDGVAAAPVLSIGYRHDDNIALVSDSSDKDSSGILEINPGLTIMAERGLDRYSISYFLSSGNYFSSSIDDYLDHVIQADAYWDIALRHRLSVGYEFDDKHEARGTGISDGAGELLDELVRYRTNNAQALYSFGSLKAFAHADFLLGWQDKTYTRYESQTKYRNWDELRFGGTLYFSASPATKLLLEAKRYQKRYDVMDLSGISRDNDDHIAYVGAEWELTGKTTGSARIGYESKQFKDDGREDFDGLSWKVGLDYLPVSYSKFTFDTSSAAKDPDQQGDYYQETIYMLGWQHDWMERFSSKLQYKHTDKDYSGAGAPNDETVQGFGISATYSYSRQLELLVGYEYNDKEITDSNGGYEQNVFYITLSGTI